MSNVLDVPYGQLGDMSRKHPITMCVETMDPPPPHGAAPPMTTTYKQASKYIPLTRATGPGGRRGTNGGKPATVVDSAAPRPRPTIHDEIFGRWINEPLPSGCSINEALSLVMDRNRRDPNEPILRIKIRMSDSSEINFARKNPNQPSTLKFSTYYSPIESTDQTFVEKFGGTVRAPPKRVPQLPHMKDLDMPTAVELKSIFHRFDFNGNGMLSLAEVDKAVKEQWPHFNNKQVLIRAFNAADQNGTGFIGKLEFKFLIQFIISYTKIMRQFTKVDTSSDKRISFEEFVAAFRDLEPSKSQSDAKGVFRTIDKNGGGFILFEEFCAYFAAKSAKAQISLSPEDINEITMRRENAVRSSVKARGVRVEAIAIPDLKRALELFGRADVNGNGALSLAELDKLVVELWPSLNNKPALMRSYKATNKNGTGLIGKKEFGFFLNYIVTYNNLWARFRELDTNGDRRVSSQEFCSSAKVLNIATETQAKIAFQQMDANGGGVVLFDEFCTWMTEVKLGVKNPTQGCKLEGMDFADTKVNRQLAAAQHGRRSNTPASSQQHLSPTASSVGSRVNSVNGSLNVPNRSPIAGRRAPPGPGALAVPTRDELMKLFKRVDVNGNGMLSLAELDKAVVELWPQFNHKPALMRAYKAADKNKTGFVSRSEFEMFIKFIPAFTAAWDMFKSIDPNGDRRISKQEFIQAAATLNLPGATSATDVGKLFDSADGNKGGFLLFDEFCGLIAKTKVQQ